MYTLDGVCSMLFFLFGNTKIRHIFPSYKQRKYSNFWEVNKRKLDFQLSIYIVMAFDFSLLMAIFLFIIWLLFGSFGSVLISRFSRANDWKTVKSILVGRSHCPACKHILGRKELIPLFSFLMQNGRCSHCKKKISALYPLLEISTGLVFLWTYLLFPFVGYDALIAALAIHWLLWLLVVADLQSYEVPLPLRGLAVLVSIVIAFLKPSNPLFLIQSIALWGGMFALIYLGSRLYMRAKYKETAEWMGTGDIFVAALIWSLIPYVFTYQGIPQDFLLLVGMFLIRIIISCLIWLLLYCFLKIINYYIPKDLKKHAVVPFVPALILGFWIILLWGKYFIQFIFW